MRSHSCSHHWFTRLTEDTPTDMQHKLPPAPASARVPLASHPQAPKHLAPSRTLPPLP